MGRFRARHLVDGVLNSGVSDTTAPTLTISVVSVTANVAAMQIVASEVVTGFAVGDITISAGGSLATFATADNITFTVSWTLAVGNNTMDINANVCQDAAGNDNTAATQYILVYALLFPDIDTFINTFAATTNYATNGALRIGKSGSYVWRTLIKTDLTSISAGSTILSAILSIYCTTDNSDNDRTMRVYRSLRAWVETEATWNIYSTGNNWATAGGFGAADCEQADIGSRAFVTAETINEYKAFTLANSAIQAMITGGAFTNNGFLLRMDTEDADHYQFSSSDAASNKPKMEIVYRP